VTTHGESMGFEERRDPRALRLTRRKNAIYFAQPRASSIATRVDPGEEKGKRHSPMKLIEYSSLPGTVPAGHWDMDAVQVLRWPDEALTIQLCEMQPHGGSRQHVHQEAHQILLVFDGELTVRAGYNAPESTLVTAGHALVIHAGEPHATSNDGGKAARYWSLTFARRMDANWDRATVDHE